MRKGENIRNEISFDGVEGLSSTQFIRAVRNKAFDDDKANNSEYMLVVASLCFDGPAMEWFERLDNDVQTDWFLLRRALLARFPTSNETQETHSQSLIFTGDNPKECEDFVRRVRQYSHSEGKSQDQQWMAHYAAGCMAGSALKWHAKLDVPARNDWIQLERALLTYFPEPPPYGLTSAGRVLVERWERIQVPSFLPTSEEAWLREARQRREAYDRAGPSGPASVHWILVENGGSIPGAAIQTGVEGHGGALFSARTWYEGGLLLGKAGRHFRAPYMPFQDKEVLIERPYEVLVGDASALRWVSNPWAPEEAKAVPSIQMKSFHAVEGGLATGGRTPLLVAQAPLNECGMQPGKVGLGWKECEIGCRLQRHIISNFRILVWAE